MIDAFEAGRDGADAVSPSPLIWSSKAERRVLRDAWQDGRSVAWSDWLMPTAAKPIGRAFN